MKVSTKAALLSGLVFPGVGQIHLKRFRRGIIVIALVVIALGILVSMATINALKTIEELQARGMAIDMVTAANSSIASSKGNSPFYYWGITGFIVCCWLFSIIDAYILGKERDLHARIPNKK